MRLIIRVDDRPLTYLMNLQCWISKENSVGSSFDIGTDVGVDEQMELELNFRDSV